MNTKGIVAIAILGLLFASTFAFIPTPVVQAQTEKLFDITIIAPGNANLLRRQWGLIIANSFKAVGINANIVFLDWGSVYDRCLTPLPENIGKTWTEGGWDALEIGWSAGAPGSEMLGAFQIYYGQNTPPGSNYFLWQNATADQDVRTFLVKGTSPEGVAAFKDWQLMQFDDVPASQIMFQSTIFSAVQGVDFNGFEWIFAQLGSVPQYVTGATTFTLGSTGEPLDMCPPLSNSWYDTIAFNPIYDAMYFIDNDYIYKPAMAVADPVISANGSEYTYTLKPGILFHDGSEVTADDVVFSYLAYLNPNSGSQQSAYIAGFLGNDITFKFLNGTESRLVIDLDAGTGVYPATTETGDRPASVEAIDTYTVKVTLSDFPGLGAPTALWHPGPDNVAILPMHLLGTLPFADWKSSVFNTGTGSLTIGSYTVTGPVGCGPYMWEGYDAATSLISESKFTDYWNATALEDDGFFGITNFYVKYIVEKDAAIAALINNEVQALDPNYQLQADYTSGNLAFAQNWVQTGAGIQQIGWNMRDPIWGTGVATPNGITDPANAATYAMYVRQAFDYLIPRELIVDNLMSGIGDPADVHVTPISAYKNTDISPREYNPTKAKQLLALAGYETGVTPPAPTPPVTEVGQAIGMYTVLESSTDSLQWTPVEVGTTDALGNFLMTYTPPVAGVQYHVINTGLEIQTAIDEGVTESDIMEYWNLPAEILSLPVAASGVWTAADTSAMTFAGNFDIAPFDALSIYNATALNNDVNSLNSRLTSVNSTLTTQAAAMQTSINSLQSQVTALNASVGSMSTIAYAGIVLAIIALLVGIVAFMRKK
jgi:ABC-type transport system substrate-binding protein